MRDVRDLISTLVDVYIFLNFSLTLGYQNCFDCLFSRLSKDFFKAFFTAKCIYKLFKLISSIQFYLRTLESGLYRNSARLDN